MRCCLGTEAQSPGKLALDPGHTTASLQSALPNKKRGECGDPVDVTIIPQRLSR